MEILKASYWTHMTECGRKSHHSLQLTAYEGESILIHTSPSRCQHHFEILSGFRAPHQGSVTVLGRDLYGLNDQALGAFPRDHMGGIPFGTGLIPEISMLEQICLPLRLAGASDTKIMEAVKEKTSELLPMHCLYNLPGKVSARRQAHGAILRATIHQPSVLILDRTLDGFDDIDSDVLWQALMDLRVEDSVLLYFTSAPPPTQIAWTQSLRI